MDATNLRSIIVIAFAVLIVGGMFLWGRYMDSHSDETEETPSDDEKKK